MNDYSEMLQALADKFGTTVKHLWEVMVYQAHISATVYITTLIGCIALLVWGHKEIKKKTAHPYPEWDSEKAFFAWLLWWFAALAILFTFTYNIESIVAGYLNPEYWALMKLKPQ